jgi:hypothetical protein
MGRELKVAFHWNANQLLNDLATSKGSSHARRRRKPSCASISEQVWMYLINPCNRSSSVWRASVLCRMDVKRDMSSSTPYSQVALFFAQRAHEGRWPSHCSIVRENILTCSFVIAWFTLVFPLRHSRQATRVCGLPNRDVEVLEDDLLNSGSESSGCRAER